LGTTVTLHIPMGAQDATPVDGEPAVATA
jgi:hypothetical protein